MLCQRPGFEFHIMYINLYIVMLLSIGYLNYYFKLTICGRSRWTISKVLWIYGKRHLNKSLDMNEKLYADGDISISSLTRFIVAKELEKKLESAILRFIVQSTKSNFDMFLRCWVLFCFQEKRLAESNDVTPFLLLGYCQVRQGKPFSDHGRLLTYIRDEF